MISWFAWSPLHGFSWGNPAFLDVSVDGCWSVCVVLPRSLRLCRLLVRLLMVEASVNDWPWSWQRFYISSSALFGLGLVLVLDIMVPNSGHWTFFPIDTLNAYTFLSIFMTSPNVNAFVLHFMQVVVSFDGLFFDHDPLLVLVLPWSQCPWSW